MAPETGRADPVPTLGKLAFRYVGERVRRGEVTKTTAANMRVHLRSFVESFGHRPLEQLGPKAMERWIEQMVAADYSPSTMGVRVSTVRGFARWCVLNGHVTRDWTIATPRIRRPRQRPRDMEEGHVEAMLAAAGNDLRLRAIVWLEYGCGLRAVEVSRLRVDDWEAATSKLFVVGKGGHEREQYVPPPVAAALGAYLRAAGHRSGPMIRPVDGAARHLTPSRISHLMAGLARDAGVKLRPYDGRSGHGLRAAGASDLMETCQDPQLVAEWLGHADLSNLRRYLRRATFERIREAVDARWGQDAA